MEHTAAGSRDGCPRGLFQICFAPRMAMPETSQGKESAVQHNRKDRMSRTQDQILFAAGNSSRETPASDVIAFLQGWEHHPRARCSE